MCVPRSGRVTGSGLDASRGAERVAGEHVACAGTVLEGVEEAIATGPVLQETIVGRREQDKAVPEIVVCHVAREGIAGRAAQTETGKAIALGRIACEAV